MHQSVINWIKEKIEEHDLDDPALEVLEVGSLDVNGSVREYFGAEWYVGIDRQPGKGVDYIASSHDMKIDTRGGSETFVLPTRSVDVVVSTEVLEHDEKFWLSLQQIYRVLRPGGWFLLTCRGIDFPKHDFPGDYYRFTVPAIQYLLNWMGLEAIEVVEDTQCSGVFGLGRKRGGREKEEDPSVHNRV